MRTVLLLLVVLLGATCPLSARAQGVPGAMAPDPLTVELLTMGPGSHPFFKFGHNAIRIRDSRVGSDNVYNFGTFSFKSETLIQDFFKGRLRYWLSRDPMGKTVHHYAREHRGIRAQELALSAEQKQQLQSDLELNALLENREYTYDYFFDNCSTRLRDAINRVTGGQLEPALRVAAMQTLRAHALRATADYFLEYLVLSIGLGPLVDRPSDRWAETFLPEMLTDAIRHVSIRSSNGAPTPLVKSETILLDQRDKRLARPPRWFARFLSMGLASATLLWGLVRLSERHRAASVTLGLSLALFGLIVGLLGCGLVALWGFTDHAVAYRNQNLLLLSPLALALPWFGLRIVARGAQAIKGLGWLSWLLMGSATLALVLKVFPLEWQDNGNLIAYFLPVWVGLWGAVRLAPAGACIDESLRA